MSGWGRDQSHVATSPSDRLADIIQNMSGNVSTLEKLTRDIGTNKDSHDLRSHMNRLRSETLDLAKEGKKLLSSLRGQEDRTKLTRLTDTFNKVLEQFEKLSRQSSQKEREVLLRTEELSSGRGWFRCFVVAALLY